MDVHIRNIGPIGDIKINCDGLTVITGKNKSGKSSVVKTLASIYLGVENFVAHSSEDAYEYVSDSIKDCFGVLMFIFDFDDKENGIRKLKNFRNLARLLYEDGRLFDHASLTETIDNAVTELENQEKDFNKIFKKEDVRFRHFMDDDRFANHALREELISELKQCEKNINSFFEKGPSYYINEELSLVFNGQVENKNTQHKQTPSIRMLEDKSVIFEHTYEVYSDKASVFPYKKCFYINNSDILDRVPNEGTRYHSASRKKHHNSLSPYITPLTDSLVGTLSTRKKPVEEQNNSTAFEKTLEIINEAVDYDYLIDSNGLAITNNGGIALANEASGAKMFLLLKRLILSGSIDENTLLMFDEPENHLHPEWQEIFAKAIVSLVKNVKIDIIVITHSPTLLLAFDVFTKDNKVNSNIYCSKNNKNGGFVFVDVTKNIEEAHQELNSTYINLDLLGE